MALKVVFLSFFLSFLCHQPQTELYLTAERKKRLWKYNSLFYCFRPFILAKQKLEDRLAAAAREKLAQASKESKEKQLQAERKRKAALFLQTLRNPLTGEPEAKRAELDLSTQLEVNTCLIKELLYLYSFFLFSYLI